MKLWKISALLEFSSCFPSVSQWEFICKSSPISKWFLKIRVKIQSVGMLERRSKDNAVRSQTIWKKEVAMDLDAYTKPYSLHWFQYIPERLVLSEARYNQSKYTQRNGKQVRLGFFSKVHELDLSLISAPGNTYLVFSWEVTVLSMSLR